MTSSDRPFTKHTKHFYTIHFTKIQIIFILKCKFCNIQKRLSCYYLFATIIFLTNDIKLVKSKQK